VTHSASKGRPASKQRASFAGAIVALVAALALLVTWRMLASGGASFDPSREPTRAAEGSADGLVSGSDGSRASPERVPLPSGAAPSATESVTALPAVERTTRVVVALARPDAIDGPWRVHAERDLSPAKPARGARLRMAATESANNGEHIGAESAVALESDWLASTAEAATLVLDDGRWIVRASGAAWSSESRRITASGGTQDVALEVFSDCVVVGRCVDADGSALAGLALTWRAVANEGEAPLELSATCGSDGHFVFERVPARPFELALGRNSESFASPQTFEAHAPTTDLGTLVWPMVARLTVRVVDANGSPLSGVAVSVNGHPRGEHAATSDLEGRVVVEGVPSMEGRAHANLPGVGRGNTPFAFDARAPQEVVVRLVNRSDDPRRR
jgi:hypothetical protein